MICSGWFQRALPGCGRTHPFVQVVDTGPWVFKGLVGMGGGGTGVGELAGEGVMKGDAVDVWTELGWVVCAGGDSFGPDADVLP